MVRVFRISLLAIIFLFLLALCSGAGWLLLTPSGAHWLLVELPSSAGNEVSVDDLDGQLLGELRLQNYRFRQEEQQLSVEKLEIHTRLASVYPLRLEVDRLWLENLQVGLPAAEEESASQLQFSWPRLPEFATWLELKIADLRLNRLRWQQAGSAAQQLDSLKAELLWQEGRLTVDQLQVQIDETLAGHGELRLGLAEPQLLIDAQLANRAVGADWQLLQAKADLQPGVESLLQGELDLELQTAAAGAFQLQSRLELAEDQLAFSQLQLRQRGRSGLLSGRGNYAFSSLPGNLNAELNLQQLDLQAEAGQPLQLSGNIQLSGQPDRYSGRFHLTSSGSPKTQGQLSGKFQGNQSSLRLGDLRGTMLAAQLAGTLKADWQKELRLQTELQIEQLQLEHLDPALSGVLNLRLNGQLSRPPGQQPNGRVQLKILDSQVYQQPLKGELAVNFAAEQLLVEQLWLQGEGLQLSAQGQPAERLELQLQVAELGQLHPELSGSFSAAGWLRWREQQLSSEFSGQGQQLGYQEWSIEQLGLRIAGGIAEHQLSLDLAQAGGQAELQLQGGWQQQAWRGELTRLQMDAPQLGRWQLAEAVTLLASATEIDLAPLRLQGGGEAELRGFGHFTLPEWQGEGQLDWQRVPLSLLAPWLQVEKLSGDSSGSISLQLADPEQSRLQAELHLQGELQRQKLKLALTESTLEAVWDADGLDSQLILQLVEGGRLQAQLESAEPLQTGLPEQGRFTLEAREIALQRLHPWLPVTLNLSGQLSAETRGEWNSGQGFSLSGQAQAEEGRLFWEEEAGSVSADFSAARAAWQWQKDLLQADLQLELSEQGEIDGQLRLPLASRWPLETLPGDLQGELSAKLQELGLLSLIFPGAVQESRGQLNLALFLAGDWQQPQLTGQVHLFEAGVFLPGLGIQLEDVELLGKFDEQQLVIDKLEILSGGGRLDGSGQLQLDRWQPGDYRFQVNGERFQLINLPDLQLRINPDLQIAGDLLQLKVRGQLIIPELLISGKQKSSLPSNSPDLVIVDAPEPPARRFALQHDIDLRLQLGERVLLNTAGIDAKLKGQLRLKSTAQQELAGVGEIQVEKGEYASYGVNLKIERGQLYFTGGPLDEPNLDILALRKIGEVQVGVRVSGTPQQPQVELYSQPSMPDADILAYIVLGRPLGGDRSQTDLLLSAAGALLSKGESVSVQEKLKQSLGLDVLDISAGDGDVTSSVITTGKYLRPDLYISLGYSLFTNENEVRLRYNLTPAWELESSIGSNSGVDMYYRIQIE